MTEKEAKAIIEPLGYSFIAFKSWFKRKHNLSVKYMKDEKELKLFIDEYDNYTMKGDFRSRYGVHYESFRNWVEKESGRKIGDLTTEEKESYLPAYRYVQFKSNTNKDTLVSIIQKLTNEIEMSWEEYSVYEKANEFEVCYE